MENITPENTIPLNETSAPINGTTPPLSTPPLNTPLLNTPPQHLNAKLTYATVIFSVVFIVIIASGAYFLYQTHKKNVAEQEKQNQIQALIQEVYTSKKDFFSLSEEQYDLFLSKPLVAPNMKGRNPSTQNNVTFGLTGSQYSPEIEVAFPYIPNMINDDGTGKNIFVRFDSITSAEGDQIFDSASGFEDENDIFTDLDLEKKSLGDVPYLYGSRDFDLIDGFELKNIAEVKGRLIIDLPINIQELTLGSADIGIEKPFAGSFVTLKEIHDDKIIIDSSISLGDLLDYNGVDAQNNLINSGGYSCFNDECEIYFENANSIRLYGSEKTVTKEIPFTFTQAAEKKQEETNTSNETNSTVSNNAPIKKTTATSNTSISAQEKEAVIQAYFDFKNVLNTYDHAKIFEYTKKVYPNNIVELEEAAYAEGVPSQEEVTQTVDMVKDFFGMDALTAPEQLRVLPESSWIRISPNDITLEVDEAIFDPVFRKTNGVWYFHTNNNF